MTKRVKIGSCPVPPQAEPDMADKIIAVVQERLNLLERKIDTLIGRFPERPLETRNPPRPFEHAGGPSRQGEGRRDGNFRQRVLHKAVCADCHKECEVPFQPSAGRPVYCKECFAKRRSAGPLREKPVAMPRETSLLPERPAVKAEPVEARKAGKKKARSPKRARKKNK